MKLLEFFAVMLCSLIFAGLPGCKHPPEKQLHKRESRKNATGESEKPDALQAAPRQPVAETPLGSKETVSNVELKPWKYYKKLHSLKGHKSWVWSLAFSPDGKILASGGQDKTIRLWNTSEGKCEDKLEEHKDVVHSLAFSPDGRMLASGCRSGEILLWNINTCKCLRKLKGHNHWVYSVTFSPDGKLLASSAGDGTVKLWNPKTGRCLHTIQAHEKTAWEVAFSHDGKYLASCRDDKLVRIWKTETFRPVTRLKAHGNPVLSVAFNHNSKLLATTGQNDPILVWDMAEDEVKHSQPEAPAYAYSVRFYRKRNILAYACRGCVKILDADSGKRLRILIDCATYGQLPSDMKGFRYSVAVSPDARLLAAVGPWGVINIWGVPPKEQMEEMIKLRKEIDHLLGHSAKKKRSVIIRSLDDLIEKAEDKEDLLTYILEKMPNVGDFLLRRDIRTLLCKHSPAIKTVGGTVIVTAGNTLPEIELAIAEATEGHPRTSKQQAANAYRKVFEKYPDTEAAKKARERYEKLIKEIESEHKLNK